MQSLKFWTVDDFEISSFKFKLNERKEKTHRTSSSDNTGLCSYTYNELGFRGDSIKKKGFKVMSVGCSNTEGIGVNYHDTWPLRFTKYISKGVNMNFGTGGRSNDFIARCLLTYYDLIKPDLVLIMYTWPNRREIYTEECGVEPFMVTNSWGYLDETEKGKKIQIIKTELQNDNEDFINWYKNHLLIKYFLESKKCNWVWNGWMGIPKEYSEFNRFDGNYNKFIDKGVDGAHAGPLHHKEYSYQLIKYIEEQHPSFIPNHLPIETNDNKLF